MYARWYTGNETLTHCCITGFDRNSMNANAAGAISINSLNMNNPTGRNLK